MGRLGARLAAQIRKYLVGILAAAATVGLVLFGEGAFVDPELLEYWGFDRLFDLRGERPPTAPIVIVSIDEASFQELDLQWPFPRKLHGQLIERISADGPLAIGLDLIFDTPSRFGPADDEALGAAIARAGNVVLALALDTADQPLYTTERGEIGVKREMTNMPLPVIRRGAAAVGAVNVRVDRDSHLRRALLRVPGAGEWWPGFDLELHRLAGASGFSTRPLPGVGEVLINYRGRPNTFDWVPYYRVVRGEMDRGWFRGKIVLIGPTSEKQKDVFTTPFARGDMPGVEIHANALDTLIHGDRIREVPKLVSTVLAGLAALVGSVLAGRLRALRALVVVVLVWIVAGLVAVAAFKFADVWMRGVAVAFGLVLGYGATVVENFVREQREKQRLSRFFSPDVLRAVVRDRDGRSLRPRRRLVTVLFSDIRGFTSISERLQPEQVDEMLQEYLTVMTEVVFRHGGTVDKYIGDAIMGLYNAPYEDPDHALKAIRTALEFQERAIPFSARWQAKLGVTIRCGVGINSGEAVVGSLGSRQRNEYTAIGDTVNLASRLESITKDFGVPIVVSETTRS
ncbi:MAG: CHASE2 domain-containing protein, partial [Candidatus Rokuibacteriota bacterium]